jgi:hypothetical protein
MLPMQVANETMFLLEAAFFLEADAAFLGRLGSWSHSHERILQS